MVQKVVGSYQYRKIYAWFGAAFGALFPIIALIIRYIQFGSQGTKDAVYHDPLLWIIATAPLFLGSLSWYAGIQRDKAQDILNELKVTNLQLQDASDEVRRQIILVEEQSRDIEIINTQLQEVNTELTEANEFKIKMLGIASHDLKNPLTNILLQAEFIKRKPEDIRVNTERAHDIIKSGEDMRRLISELLDATALYLGKIQLHVEFCDIVNVLHSTVDLYQVQIQAKQQKITIHSPSSLVMQCDVARIRQVFENLLSNAIKYSVLHGEIMWSIREHQSVAGVIEIRVKDSGQGFTEDDKTKIFGMFQRLSAKPTGGESSSGMGLASVKNIVELHGGTIELESVLGQGATFIVCLPQFQTVVK